MKPVALTPTLAAALTKSSLDRHDIVSGIDDLAAGRRPHQPERIPGRSIHRTHANGHRILYRETKREITVLCVRPTVRRRWEALLS